MTEPAPDSRGPQARLLPQGTVVIVTLAATLIALLALRELSSVIAPVILALVFTIAAEPVRRNLAARGAPTWLSTAAGILVVYAIVLLLAWAALILTTHIGSLVADYDDDFRRSVGATRDWLVTMGVEEEQLSALIARFDLGTLLGLATVLLGGAFGVLTDAFFIVVLLFFTLTDAGSFTRRLAEASARGARMAAIFGNFAEGTRSYLRIATLFGAVVALIDVLALYLIGIPNPWLWGLLAFLTNYIPNIGFLIGVAPPALIALMEEGPGTALLVIAVYSVVNFVLQTIVQPKIVGDSVGLSGTLSFLSLIVWGTVFGGIGAVVAIPLTLLVRAVFVDTDPDRRWLGPLLGGDAEPHAPDPERDPD